MAGGQTGCPERTPTHRPKGWCGRDQRELFFISIPFSPAFVNPLPAGCSYWMPGTLGRVLRLSASSSSVGT